MNTPTTEIERPEVVETEHLEYLDTLRESGITNIFGAGTFIVAAFGVSKSDATEILKYWMRTFGKENR